MFLKQLIEKNSNLLNTAITMHQEGILPPNTWLLDLDTIYKNAMCVAQNAKKASLITYFMTKQIGRNPFAVKTALKAGINKTVAVDINGAKILHRYGIPIGHLGHLSQIPKHDYKHVVKMKPDVVTIYSYETALYLNEACQSQDYIQDILIKVADEDGLFLPGQESGILIAQFNSFVKRIITLKNINIVGLTAFPCVTYNNLPTDELKLTKNIEAIKRARKILETQFNIYPTHINTPGNTSTLTLPLFKDIQATHVEPGHGITGTTPVHIYAEDAPEVPALVYVSEISHLFREHAYAFGGGLYVCMGGGPKNYTVNALVGPSLKKALTNQLTWSQLPLENIDYYGMLSPSTNARVGDTTLFGFRPQMFITRANIAVVSGVNSSSPKLLGIFDSAGNMVDESHNVVSPDQVNRLIDEYLNTLDLI